MSDLRKQKTTPETVRGLEVESLKAENLEKNKKEKLAFDNKMQLISGAALVIYMLFFAFLYKLLLPAADQILQMGIGLQAIVVTLTMLGINSLFKKYYELLPILKNRTITQMLQVYALICIIIALVSINDIPKNLLDLAVD